jgi:hypothetical protein
MATETRTDVRPVDQMQTQPQVRERYEPRTTAQPGVRDVSRPVVMPRGDETKLSIKTTEFWIYLAAVGAILIASQLIGTNANHADYFRGDKAWFFITILTLGYLGSRGLAKAGSMTRDRGDEERR